MKLIKFRIKNFKSIRDTGECELASDITILAGKNEAGKTVILQSLEKFNDGKKFSEEDKPIDRKKAEPEVTLTFKLSKDDFSTITEDIKIPSTVNKKALSEIPFSITKTFNNDYSFEGPSGSIIDLLFKKPEKENGNLIQKLDKQWSKVREVFQTNNIQSYPLQDIESVNVDFVGRIKTDFLPNIEQFIIQLPSDKQEDLRNLKNEIEGIISDFENSNKTEESNQIKLMELIPEIVLFDAFDEKEFLPFEIGLNEAKENQAVKNYCALAELDLDELVKNKDNTQEILGMVKGASAKIEGDFRGYWKQGEKKIDLRLDIGLDNKLVFGFYEKGKKKPFRLDQRSKGLQWFLSFYLTVGAECEQYKSIILIDEPGLFVHAKAQQDILEVLTDRSKENQIIFTTHSPYLIDPDRLDRIRLVVKDLRLKINKKETLQRGTRTYLLNEISEKETLTPIITAIGLDISKSLTISADNNIVLEGPSDYYYLQSALKFCNINAAKKTVKNFNLMPCTGANNIPSVVSILFAWRLNSVVVLDNDEKGKEIHEIFSRRSLVKEEKIIFISANENYCMEDLFSKSDFNKFILGKPDNYETGKFNSQIVPDSQKLILSRKFFNSLDDQKFQLSKETKNNFSELLKRIFDALSRV